MTGYQVTQWRDRDGEVWERTPRGAWSADGAPDVYDTTEALDEAWGPLQAVDVDNVEALLRERDWLRRLLAAKGIEVTGMADGYDVKEQL